MKTLSPYLSTRLLLFGLWAVFAAIGFAFIMAIFPLNATGFLLDLAGLILALAVLATIFLVRGLLFARLLVVALCVTIMVALLDEYAGQLLLEHCVSRDIWIRC